MATADHAGFSIGGAALTLLASATWAAGSLLAPRLRLPIDPIIGLTTQLAAAALLLLGVDLIGWAEPFDPAAVSTAGWTALAFLVVASTLVGYAVFLWLNRAVSSTLANTFNYASPVVALLLSAAMLDEKLTWSKAGAAGIVLAGVALMLEPSSKPAQSSMRRRLSLEVSEHRAVVQNTDICKRIEYTNSATAFRRLTFSHSEPTAKMSSANPTSNRIHSNLELQRQFGPTLASRRIARGGQYA